MNKKQKTCLLVGIAAVVAMGLFPPWVLERREMNILGGGRYEYKHTTVPGPYSWIGDPPQAKAYSCFWIGDDFSEKRVHPWSYDPPEERARFIDLYRLGVQYFVVAVVTAGLIIVLKNRKGIAGMRADL